MNRRRYGAQPRGQRSLWWIWILVALLVIGVGIGFWLIPGDDDEQDVAADEETLVIDEVSVDEKPEVEEEVEVDEGENETEEDKDADDSSAEGAGEVDVIASGDGLSFSVKVGGEEVDVIEREEASVIDSIVERDGATYVGLIASGIGGNYYVGPDEVWKIDPTARTVEEVVFSGRASAISPDEKQLAVSSADGGNVLRVVGVGGGEEKSYTFDGYTRVGNTLFSPDGSKIAVQVYDDDAESDPYDSAVIIVGVASGNQYEVVRKEGVSVAPLRWEDNDIVEYTTNPGATGGEDF